ncbi:MAG: LysM peptidoglycan-binding domain-containing protein [Akkermansiaceae bacterium]
MKTLALTTTIFVASAASMLAQGQSEIDALRSRAESHERRISILEKELSRLRRVEPKAKPTAPSSSSSTHGSMMAKGTSGSSQQYVVKKGDILTRIAYRNKTSVAAIKKANGMKNDHLSIGQKLIIPGSKSIASKAVVVDEPSKKPSTLPKPAASSTARGTHLVKSGETFYAIARKHKVSVSSMMAANPKVEPSRLQPGMKLVINGAAKAPSRATAKSEMKPLSKVSNQKPASKTVKKAPAQKRREVAKRPVERVADPSNTPKEVVRNAPADRTPEPVKEDSIRTITVHQQMTYGQFASRYGSSTSQLNALNGLSLNKNTMLAKGSELYVPQ